MRHMYRLATVTAVVLLTSCESDKMPAGNTVATVPPATAAKTISGCTSTLTGAAAFTDFTGQIPGVCHAITPADLPQPASSSVANYSTLIPRKTGQLPSVPTGFRVQLYATGFTNPRLLATAPNGDIFLADSGGNTVRILHGVNSDGSVQTVTTFASGLNYPFGIAFYPSGANPQYVYIANSDSVVRFPYQNGDTTARGAAQRIIPSLPAGGHSTRTLAFTSDNRLLVSIGSNSNLTNTDTDPGEANRADILAYTPDGTFLKQYATGLRNAVGLTTDSSGNVWAAVNERDGLGDNLPPDFVTRVSEGGFYGWPWYYIGANPDPRLPPNHPELAGKSLVPDVLLQPHSAPLQIAFYNGKAFPSIYQGDLFVAQHGSWNRSVRGGYEVVRIILINGQPSGYYEDFIAGLVNTDGTVWCRPVGVTIGADGALYFSDDASNSVWRVSYTG
jgi:glucose/arabinose dehydrogenase